jgi:hypothetical protein
MGDRRALRVEEDRLATGYRGLLDRFDAFLDTVTKLETYWIL